MTPEEILERLGGRKAAEELLLAGEEAVRREERRKIFHMYPEFGPLSRRGYKKHMAFFEAGATYQERLACCANRVGKTEGMGGYELVCHLTGIYPAWWKGRRFERPIRAWVSGESGKETRDIIQKKLCGEFDALGTGLIPGELISKKTMKAGVPEAFDQIWVRHLNRVQAREWPNVDTKHCPTSVLTFKSYDQKRESFQGSELDVIWLDEEPPQDVYTECLLRLMTTNGIMMVTFTPLKGMSDVVRLFFDTGVRGGVDNRV